MFISDITSIHVITLLPTIINIYVNYKNKKAYIDWAYTNIYAFNIYLKSDLAKESY